MRLPRISLPLVSLPLVSWPLVSWPLVSHLWLAVATLPAQAMAQAKAQEQEQEQEQEQDKPQDKAQESVVLTGRLLDEQLRPVVGAGLLVGSKQTMLTSLALAAPTARSDAKGRFRVKLPARQDPGPKPELLPGILVAARGRMSMFMSRRGRRWHEIQEYDVGTVILLRGATLRGQVRGAGDKPLAGVRVTAHDLIFRSLSSPFGVLVTPHSASETDARGAFVLPGAPPNAGWLVLRKAGYHKRVVQPVGKMTPLNIRMHTGGFVEGRVAAGTAGPWWVQVSYEAQPQSSSDTRCGPDGSFKISLDYPGRYHVTAYASPPTERYTIPREWPALRSRILNGPARRVQVQLQQNANVSKPATVQVHAVDRATGKRVVVDEVWLYNGFSVDVPRRLLSQPRQRRKPDPKGSVQFSPRSRKGGCLLVMARGFAPAAAQLVSSGKVELKLDRGATIAGTVVDEAGRPIAGATVWSVDLGVGGRRVVNYSRIPPRHVKSDRDGRYELHGLASGLNCVQAFVPGRPIPDARKVQLTAGKTTEGVRLQVRSGTTLRGRLEGDGKVGPGWRMHLKPQRQSPIGTATFQGDNQASACTVSEDARFQFAGLRKGSYTLQLTRPDVGRFSQPLRFDLGRVFVSEKEDPELTFDAARYRSGTVQGTVRLANVRGLGRHIVVAAVPKVLKALGPRPQATVIDPAGHFTLQVVPGEYDIRVYDAWTCMELHHRELADEIQAGDKLKIDLHVKPRRVQVKLRPHKKEQPVVVHRIQIRSLDNQAPATDVRHFLNLGNMHLGFPENPRQAQFSFHVPPGEYKMVLFHMIDYLQKGSEFDYVTVSEERIQVTEQGKNEFVIPVKSPRPKAR